MSAASVGANPHVNPQAQAAGINFSGKDALLGGLVGSLIGSPILGAGIGSIARSLFGAMNAGDMNAAYDPARAQAGGQTFDFGNLKGMFDGLFGNIRDSFQAGGAGPQQAQRAQANGEFSNQPPPEGFDASQQAARPGVGPDVQAQAQQGSGFKWGKALKWGGIALAGMTLLNSMPFMGGFGMPFYGGGMMNPMMMGMGFPGFTF